MTSGIASEIFRQKSAFLGRETSISQNSSRLLEIEDDHIGCGWEKKFYKITMVEQYIISSRSLMRVNLIATLSHNFFVRNTPRKNWGCFHSFLIVKWNLCLANYNISQACNQSFDRMNISFSPHFNWFILKLMLPACPIRFLLRCLILIYLFLFVYLLWPQTHGVFPIWLL